MKLRHNFSDSLLDQKNDTDHIADWPSDAPGFHAHHIVMKKGQGAAKPIIRNTQRLLQEAGIDPIFGYDNLVWAPNWSQHRSGTVASPRTSVDNTSTGKGYAKSVYDQLNETDRTNSAIKLKLEAIARLFIKGIW